MYLRPARTFQTIHLGGRRRQRQCAMEAPPRARRRRQVLFPREARDVEFDAQANTFFRVQLYVQLSRSLRNQLKVLSLGPIKHNPGSLWRARYLPSDNYPITRSSHSSPHTPTHTPHLWNIRP